MCGIAGYIHRRPEAQASAEILQRMTDVIVHRGPDAQGHHVHGNVALGHRRLSIIDLATGDQPMRNPDGTCVITYNGEIYNYIELRDELRALGHTFQTESDTEVILHAYDQWGLDCQTRFNGMWAFALWDDRAKRLVLSRDRFGEKPLHYVFNDDALVFASEIKSLFAYGHPQEKDFKWAEVFCTMGYIPAPHSFFRGVFKLPPASCLVYENDGIKVFPYWEMPEIDEDDMLSDRKEVEEKFAFLLRDSIRLRMRSDVPYGAFLSGGLDSSSIVALMSSITPQPVRTFTIGFGSRRHDERLLARQVADKFATDHHEHEVEPEGFEEALQRVIHHYDEPFGDSSAIPVGLVSQNAARQVKMVLTGDGGDEALSGYTAYQGEKFARNYQRLPGPLRRSAPGVVRKIAAISPAGARLTMARMSDVFTSSNMAFTDRLIQKVSWSGDVSVKQLLSHFDDQVPIEDLMETLMAPCPYRDNFYRLMYFNLKVSLPDDMLVKVDRMSMAHSLEVRTPFLDYRLIETMVRVDKNIKMPGMQRKSILRNTIGRRLPPALLKAPKRGFSVPIAEWFKDSSFDKYVHELTSDDGLPYDKTTMQSIIDANAAGQRDMGNLLWILILLQRYC
jgi:asparagine synthase (glutamine-hydrolysing)